MRHDPPLKTDRTKCTFCIFILPHVLHFTCTPISETHLILERLKCKRKWYHFFIFLFLEFHFFLINQNIYPLLNAFEWVCIPWIFFLIKFMILTSTWSFFIKIIFLARSPRNIPHVAPTLNIFFLDLIFR